MGHEEEEEEEEVVEADEEVMEILNRRKTREYGKALLILISCDF